jgi:hypothetical protein
MLGKLIRVLGGGCVLSVKIADNNNKEQENAKRFMSHSFNIGNMRPDS